MLKRISFFIILMALSIPCFADTEVANDVSDASQEKINVHHCPFPWELQKEGLHWVSKNGKWRSNSQYFSAEIEGFRAVQWSGVIVGEVICLYKGKGSLDFPIAMQPVKTILVVDPKGKEWVKRASNSKAMAFKECVANDVQDCLFESEVHAVIGDIYETIKYQR